MRAGGARAKYLCLLLASVAASLGALAACGGQPSPVTDCSWYVPPRHGAWQPNAELGCVLQCEPSWTPCGVGDNCDCLAIDATVPPGVGNPDAGPGQGRIALATLTGAPGGVAVDGTRVYYLDGDALRAVDVGGGPVATLAIGLVPAGGIAVRGGDVYVPQARTSSSPGSVTVIHPDGDAGAVVTGVDPGAGIEADDASVLWLSRSDFDAGPGVVRSTLGGGASTWLLSADGDADTYKVFAASSHGVYGISGGALSLARVDGGVSPITDGGGVAVGACPLGWEIAVTRGADGGESIRGIVDAGLASGSPVNGAVTALGCTSDGTVLMATDERIWAVPGQSTMPLVDGQAGVAYVAGTATRLVWVTRATQSQPGGVWSEPR